ncbi:MAG: alpha/beta fold hydrolase [Pikeienuella sp.]
MSEVKIGGHTVRYIEEGSGPLALFAHCSLAHSGLWRPVMEALSDRWHCVAIDMPAHGGSDRGSEDISLQFQAAAYVEGVAETFGGGPAHLVGLSLGGAVVGRVADRSPHLARSLTMLEPIFFHVIADRDPQAIAENNKVMNPVVKACLDGRFHDGARLFMEGWGQPGQFERLPERARDSIARSLSYLYPDFELVGTWPKGQITRDGFGSMTMPTLLLEGARTRDAAKRVQRELATLIPNAVREDIADAGHLSPVDQPQAVAARLRRFWESIEAG